MRKLIAPAVVVAALFLARHAPAQITLSGLPSTSNAAGIQFISPLTGGVVGPAGGTLTLSLKTDFNYTPTAGQDSSVYITISQNFTVGPLPVQITSLSYTANAKWVNGGGTMTDPVTSWDVVSNIYYGPQFVNYAMQTPDLTGTQTGNGFTIVNGGNSNTQPFVLANGQSYQLYFIASTDINATNLPANAQPSVFTLEAGGISGFNGFSATLNWRTVPEPSTLGLMLPAVLMVIRRRRLKGC
jgi:hypothetical protein